jgi:RNA polymerase sigma factor (sigma-70 family)
MNDDNNQILAGLKSGNSVSYERLYSHYFPAVEKFVLKNSGTPDDAKDIFQDSLLIPVEKLRADNFVLTASLKTYVIAICKNLWYKKMRNSTVRKEIALDDIMTNQLYIDITTSIENERTYLEKLQFYLSKITTHCNQLLQAMFFKNKSIDEIQAEYGYSSKHNAQNQKHKCIEQVRKIKVADEDEKK